MPPSLISVPRPGTTVVENPFAVTTRTAMSTGSRVQRRALWGTSIPIDHPPVSLIRTNYRGTPGRLFNSTGGEAAIFQQHPPAQGIPIEKRRNCARHQRNNRCGAQTRRALKPVKEYERRLREISAMGKKIKMRPKTQRRPDRSAVNLKEMNRGAIATVPGKRGI